MTEVAKTNEQMKDAGGVCSPEGFRASGICCGIKGNGEKDLALIVSDEMCSVAGVFTRNKVKGAPIQVTKQNISDGRAIAVICNSGNANTCAANGVEIAEQTCALTGAALGIKSEDVVVCSTGVIGQELCIEPFEAGMSALVEALSCDGGSDAAKAIMTTDTIPKTVSTECVLNGKICKIGGMAKGSGMINPNMATMLSFITTDANISPDMLQRALSENVKRSFNQICVDGDTSTNDSVIVMANGLAKNAEIREKNDDYEAFKRALLGVMVDLSKKIARDGEGATKLIECSTRGVADENTALAISKSVIASDLFKAAMFGKDANWGRVLCAIGYTEGEFDTDNIDVVLSSRRGSIAVCKGSMHKEFDEQEATAILSEDEIHIDIDMNRGECGATAWGCDLTYEYVRINGDYRS